MIRRSVIAGSAKPIGRSRIKYRARRAKPGDDPEYRNFLRDECKCLVCLKIPVSERPLLSWLIDPAHTRHGGMSLKGPDSSCVPLCRGHHSEQHQIGMVAFQDKYAIDLPREAQVHFAVFLISKESQK